MGANIDLVNNIHTWFDLGIKRLKFFKCLNVNLDRMCSVELRSFFGVSNYYRFFTKDLTNILKPLTEALKGKNGKVSANLYKKVTIVLYQNQIKGFSIKALQNFF